CGLIIIGRLSLLNELYIEIIIPTAVKDEILKLEIYGIELTEFYQAEWISIQDPVDAEMEIGLQAYLDKGESAAITLAYELSADILIIDERAGRKIAKSLDINIIGLIGILAQGKESGIIPRVKPLLDRLRTEANFYISEKLYDEVLKGLEER
ncbi:MAG: DUF3368 domain-containing protein, partial [Bacteroidota bacterium]